MKKDKTISHSEKREAEKSSAAHAVSHRAAGGELHQIEGGEHPALTTNQGLALSDNQNSLRTNPRGPALLEDFILREKITHFDHERIPERIVHARTTGVHGYFELTASLKQYTTARVLTEVGEKTPVFTRLSTVAGGAGSVDTPRDVRGFAVKFYTKEGNWDLVGNNVPVFFIQDAIKFPDLIHAVKMEPDRGLPTSPTRCPTTRHAKRRPRVFVAPQSLKLARRAASVPRASPTTTARRGSSISAKPDLNRRISPRRWCLSSPRSIICIYARPREANLPGRLLCYLTQLPSFSRTRVQKPCRWKPPRSTSCAMLLLTSRRSPSVRVARSILNAANVGRDGGIVDANDQNAFIAVAKTRQWMREKSVRTLA